MKNLIEISKIVTKRKVKKIEIFDEYYLKYKSSKFNEFYEALAANKFKNDRDAATFLYNSTPTDPKYRQLKSRFKKRLLNTLFFWMSIYQQQLVMKGHTIPQTRIGP